MAPPLTVAPSPSDTAASAYEQANVHEVYNLIATHFSATRYKQWPSITRFLHSIPPGSLGLDAGCGNGKYLPAWDGEAAREKGCYMVGLDRSDKLLELAKRCGYEPGQPGEREVCVGDVLDLGGVRAGSMDFAISIATLHHISLPARRLQTVRTFLRALAPTHGQGMIYVWALEQSSSSRRHAPGEQRRGAGEAADEGEVEVEGEQDVFVPWVLSKEAPKTTADALRGVKSTKVRKPQKGKKHLTRDAESDDVDAVGATLAALPTPSSATTSDVAADAPPPPAPPASPPKVYQRYYHLFKRGELSALVQSAAEAEGLHFIPFAAPAPADEDPDARAEREAGEREEQQSRDWVKLDQLFWEKDNWVCVLRRGRG